METKSKHGHRILVVDDDEETLEMLKQALALENSDYEVYLAGTGEKALEIAKEYHPISLLIADYDLGEGMNGLELCQWFKAEYPQTCRFMISGHYAEDKLIPCKESGDIHLFSTKPLFLADVLKDVRIGIRQFESARSDTDGKP